MWGPWAVAGGPAGRNCPRFAGHSGHGNGEAPVLKRVSKIHFRVERIELAYGFDVSVRVY